MNMHNCTCLQETLRLHQSELEAAKRELEKQDASRRELEKLQEGMRRSEQEISSKDEKIAGLEKQLKDVEVRWNDNSISMLSIFFGRQFLKEFLDIIVYDQIFQALKSYMSKVHQKLHT